MRILSLAVLVFLLITAAALARPAEAADVPASHTKAQAMVHAAPPRPVNDHDESRVAVQLVVAGVAAGLVVGVGTAAYMLRRKLGLTAYTPDKDAGGHH
jgi:hypothetical protein